VSPPTAVETIRRSTEFRHTPSMHLNVPGSWGTEVLFAKIDRGTSLRRSGPRRRRPVIAMNATRMTNHLDVSELAQVAALLGHPVRQVLSYY
jgi:hypothetical protein